MFSDPEAVSDDERLFIDAANLVSDTANKLDDDLAFMACATVMLDRLEFLLSDAESSKYVLMLANQVHAEFLALMADHGYVLSINSVQ
jgi:hypothetical protein